MQPARPPAAGARAFCAASSSAAALMSLALTCRSGRSSLSASATAPLPVPRSSTRAPARQLEADLDQQLGLRARDQRAAIDGQLEAAEARGVRRCRRPARAPPRGGARRPGRRARPGPATRQLAVGQQPLARSTPSTCASSSSASSRGVSQPAAAIAVTAPVERLARGRRRSAALSARSAGCAAHRSACASRRRRFSSACSAAVSSSSSPSSTWSRLCTVSLMRWSVTRRSP